MAKIDFPPGWSSERLDTISAEDFIQVPEDERAVLKQAVRRHAFSPEYAKLQKLNKVLSAATARPPTPPSYVPPGWTIEQARGLDMRLVDQLSAEEQRLWAAGKCADTARQARKTGHGQAAEPSSYVPTGWSAEQAMSPTFELLSRLPHQDLRRYMQSRNEQTASLMCPHPASPALAGATQLPSPLVQALQDRNFPAWGFVLVRTYYASETRWQAFQSRLDTLCDEQLDQEAGEGLQRVRDSLEFKMIEDPRLAGVSHAEARRHFHAARDMGGVAAGLDLSVLLLVDENVVNSVLGDGAQSSSGPPLLPYLVAVDVSEPTEDDEYPGFFRVSVDALLSELYPKLWMGLSARDLGAMLRDSQTVWTGDDE